MLLLSSPHGEFSEHQIHALSETSELHKPCLYGKEKPGPHQQKHKNVVGQIKIDFLHNLQHCLHDTCLLMVFLTECVSPRSAF